MSGRIKKFGGTLFIPDTLVFPDDGGILEELAEATGMTIVCGPESEIQKISAVEQEKERTAERLAAPRRYDPQAKAKELVAEVFNAETESGLKFRAHRDPVLPEDVYAVSFSFILGGWKGMFSSDAWDDTSYFEVTHNVAKGETYVDHYRKVSNTCFKDGE